MTNPPAEPYEPFPSFAEFSAAPFDPTAFAVYANEMSQAKAGASKAKLAAAVDRATRFAAVDTGAIEGLYEVDRGFTLSVATEAAAWENIHLVKGDGAAHYIADALRGYEYVMDFATRGRRVTENGIRELHSVLCASQTAYTVVTDQGVQEQGLVKGSYKIYPNNPVNVSTGVIHSYAPVDSTPAEMARLSSELGAEAFDKAHPVIQAAYAHYAFVCIHPFADGNGRVARALASAYLYRTPGVPLVIFADQKADYLDSLELADGGDYRGFIRFIADRAIDTVKMVTTDLRRAIPTDVREGRIATLQASLLGRGGLPHSEIDRLGATLLHDFYNVCLTASLEPILPQIETQVTLEGIRQDTRFEHLRSLPQAQIVRILATFSGPVNVSQQLVVTSAVTRPGFLDYDFALVRGVDDILGTFDIRDLYPSTTLATTYSLRAIADSVIWDLANLVADDAVASLGKQGYL